MTLAEIKVGQDAVLRTIGSQGELRHHLLDMGLTRARGDPAQRLPPWATPSKKELRGTADPAAG